MSYLASYTILPSSFEQQSTNSVLLSSPNKVLRSFPQLNADLIKSVTIGIIKKIPDDIYADIVAHAL